MSQYRAFKATHLPTGSFNTAYVYDYDLGGVARDETGRLAYFRTMAEAKRWVAGQASR